MSVGVQLNVDAFAQRYGKEFEYLQKYRRISNYLSAAQIFLKDNFYLKESLKPEHIKDRLLGHWGTCPGLTLIYSHCNLLIRNHDLDMFIVVGPGHGAPAILSNLFLEGSLEKYYPEYRNDSKGFSKLIREFSWPGGFPSHVNSEFPGSIHEGGELGYALAVSFGAVMDNPDLIVTCVVGDGECETGPTATAWHSYKFLDPAESGAVLPIIHLNEYKISSKTIYGSMSNEDLQKLFEGYGYSVRFVQDLNNIDADLGASMEWAVNQIRTIQKSAREGNPKFQPRWPILILRTPKGWGCMKELDGKKIEGTFRSHQVPAKDPIHNKEQLAKLEEWLKSYKIGELIDKNGSIKKELLDHVIPQKNERKMGLNPYAMPDPKSLQTPNLSEMAIKEDKSGNTLSSPTKEAGKYLAKVIEMNPKTFRIFSPDELESNKLDEILSVTSRNAQWSKGEDGKVSTGRIVEVLSEHDCEGWLQGYILTGRYGLFPSYETFLGIITTMMIQFAKFKKLGMETGWRKPTPSLNYIETSTLWRQEHNGYSHQDPMFINNLANMKGEIARVYLPPDANCFLSVLDHCIRSQDRINLMIGTKKEMPSLLSFEEAKEHCKKGASIWKWLSTDEGRNPDIVIVGCGNETNLEAIAGTRMLQKDVPNLRVRFVNVVNLFALNIERAHPHAIEETYFQELFPPEIPVIFNFHGYPSVVRGLLFGRKNTQNFHVLGYIEEGTTTSPFKMLTDNKVSRYHVAMEALKQLSGKLDQHLINNLTERYHKRLQEHDKYVRAYGKDPEYLSNFLAFSSEQSSM